MKKLLLIGGPTATGKTKIALQLIKEIKGEIISADSRQVYRGMDIGTGKDVPRGTKIWGYDVVNPNEEFSVAAFVRLAWLAAEKIWQEDKLPIMVGGTGLYLRSIINPPASLWIKPNRRLRNKLTEESVSRLQERLRLASRGRFEQMNDSDRKNPRRLIRAIEVALAEVEKVKRVEKVTKELSVLWIGLTAAKNVLDERIVKRVESRASGGMTEEVSRLMEKYPNWNYPAFSAAGYWEWRSYLEGKYSRQQAKIRWGLKERQYARSQLTWFRKMSDWKWFDISDKTCQNQVKKLVKEWWNGKITKN